MRRSLGRTAGTLAVVHSILRAIAAAVFTAVGVVLVVSGRSDDASVDPEGFLEFVGSGVIVVGLLTLASAVLGIVLGRRTVRGEGSASVGLIALFALFAAVSGMFLASALADEFGVDVGAAVLFGANTAACVAVVLLALFAHRGG